MLRSWFYAEGQSEEKYEGCVICKRSNRSIVSPRQVRSQGARRRRQRNIHLTLEMTPVGVVHGSWAELLINFLNARLEMLQETPVCGGLMMEWCLWEHLACNQYHCHVAQRCFLGRPWESCLPPFILRCFFCVMAWKQTICLFEFRGGNPVSQCGNTNLPTCSNSADSNEHR